MSSSVAAAQTRTVRKVALLVGVEHYEKRGFSDLNYAEDDMVELGKVLKAQGFEVTMLLGSAEGSGKANLQTINDALNKTFVPQLKKLNKEDICLVALAGHGRHGSVTVGGTPVEDHFYCPCDAHDSDTSTWISISGLIKEIEAQSGSERNLILIDACRDNPSRGRGVDGKGMSLNRDAVAVLFASSYNEQAYEPDELTHGLFTYYVLQALSGDARNFDGEVTWDSMVDFVKGRVESKSLELEKLKKIAGIQRPNSMGNLRGQSPVLARVGKDKKASITNADFAKYYADFARIEDAATDLTYDQLTKTVGEKVRGTSFLLAIEALRLEGLGFRKTKVLDQLEALRDAANKIEPGSQHTHLINAILLRVQGKNEAAIAEYSAAIKENPLLVDAYLGLVWTQTEGASRTKQGTEFARSLLEKFPKDNRVYNTYATRLFNDNEYEKGLKYMEKAIELEPNSALLWNNKAYGLDGAKRTTDSIEAYRKAGQLAWTRDAWILSNVARSFAQTDDYVSASKYARQATKLDPTLPGPWQTLSDAKYEAKDLQGAIDVITEGIKVKQSPELFASRIYLNLERNNTAAAAEDMIRLELLSDDLIVWAPPKVTLLAAQSKVAEAINLADRIIAEAEKRQLSAQEIEYYRKLKQRIQSK